MATSNAAPVAYADPFSSSDGALSSSTAAPVAYADPFSSSSGSLPSSSAFPSSTPYQPSTISSSFRPLTSVFPVPSSCFDQIYSAVITPPGGDITAFRDYWGEVSACYPESYAQFEYPSSRLEASWYSPGLCPSGYSIASSTYDNVPSATKAWCCPGAAE